MGHLFFKENDSVGIKFIRDQNPHIHRWVVSRGFPKGNLQDASSNFVPLTIDFQFVSINSKEDNLEPLFTV